ncbi:hypothetical protein KKA39_02045, partial [Patescibacteria group bacterium]|nr:hypothetical protein [Patescibacteria group bacterium]
MEKDQKNSEEEDIAIDFSQLGKKIKGFFKTEKETKSSEETEQKQVSEKEEDLSIDFSQMGKKIKNLFNNDKDKTSLKTSSEHEEDLSFDFSKVTDFTKKHSRWLIPLVLIFIAIGFSTYFRMMPADLPITDDWAQNTVYNYYREQIGNQINQQYPNLPQQNRDLLVEKEWQKQLKENKDSINQQIDAVSQQYKAQLQDDSGQTYLLAIDPYLWFGEMRNNINYGHFGTEVVDGKEINFLRNGKDGKPGEPGSAFHLYFGVFLYKFVHFFSGNISLLNVVFLIPVIIIGLALIPAFFIGRKIAGNVGGFFAAIIVAINTALLGRTPAGFADTDAYNVFFPLLVLWLVLETLDADKLKKKIIYAAAAGLSCGLFSRAWGGWWYVFDFVLATLGIYIIYHLIINIKKKRDVIAYFSVPKVKNSFISGGLFLLASLICVSIISTFKTFISAFSSPLGVITLKQVAISSVWPNVMTTVAEFNTNALNTIVSQMGGKILFFIAMLGILLTILKKDKEGSRDPKYATFLIVWFIGTAYGFTKGIRFSILMVPAFAVAFGAGIGIIYEYLNQWLSKNISISNNISKIILIMIICLSLLSPIQAANNTAKNEIPSMNDAWYN